MTVKTSVSFSKVLLVKAQQRAKDAGFPSLSAYLQDLVRRDIREAVRDASPNMAEDPSVYGDDDKLVAALNRVLQPIKASIDRNSDLVSQFVSDDESRAALKKLESARAAAAALKEETQR